MLIDERAALSIAVRFGGLAYFYTSAIFGESQIRRYHGGRIWYDAPTRVARAMVLVLAKGECALLSRYAEISV